jgi:pimeloyl-ACP methyl ester carboxylesterase
MKRILALLMMMALCMGSIAHAGMPKGEYLAGKNSTTAVILAHGRGQGPDSNVVGPLRKGINKQLGFHTLSLQMPVLSSTNYQDYAPTFPDAFKAIQAAIDYLTIEKGVKRIYLMGYSMGARMTTAFLAERPTPVIVGYIGVGLLEGGGKPLDANQNLSSIRLPVIDIFADKTPLDLKSAENRRSMVSDTFKQARISGADHSFRGYDDQIVQAVIEWLKEREGTSPR